MVTWNIVATSALGVFSSKYFRSKVQNIAAAKTQVGAFLSHLSKQSAAGSGNMFFLQYLITSCRSASVAAVVGGGGGVESSDAEPGGNTIWIVGGMAAASTRVICSGVMSEASSAIP